MSTSVSLKVNIVKLGSVKTMKFNGDMIVQEVCREIRDKLGEEQGQGNDHGLFFPDQGKWLDGGRTLDYYDLKTGDLVEYKKKHRPLRVKMVDETVKTILVDESLTVAQLVGIVCSRIGIQNSDEFSFTTEANEAKAAKPQELKKSKTQDKLLAENKKTAETIWLNPEKSLREQGVDENEVLVLKKKFFFSDQNIDRNDPIQLNLLYVQALEAIVKGTHPCTLEEAAQFAALQCQVQYGNHEPDRHKPGFLHLEEFLPPEYCDKKEIDKKIFQEHRKLQGMTELNAKFRYVQLCRSLKTYGVTFFLCKEKVAKKNKMIKILLGITRESVMRLDAETKEVLKVWSLTTLRRWAASPNSFTLDFGDYSDSYYSVQTSEGDQISQLIAGYIDIILKKKKDAERILNDEDTELAITEENIGTGQATAITLIPGKSGQALEVNVAQSGMLNSPDSQNAYKRMSTSQQMQYFNASSGLQNAQIAGGSKFSMADITGASGAQQALLQQINNGFASVNSAQSDLNVATSLPPLGNDPASVQWRKQTLDINKQNVVSQVSAHLAATAAILNLTSVDPAKMDYNQIGSNVSTISSNLAQLASGTKMIAALMEDAEESEKLLEAARKLASATSKMLTESQPIIMGQGNRQELLASAQGIGGASSQMLKHMGDPDVSMASQQELIDLAKNVAAAMTKAVAEAKNVAGKCPDQKSQQDVVAATKESASSATQLVTTTQVVSSTINSPLCQKELIDSAHLVEDAVAALMAKGKAGCSDQLAIADLAKSIDEVKASLQKLVDKARLGGQSEGDLSEIDRQAEIVMAATQSLINASGDSAAIIANAKSLALATTQLVNALRQQAANVSDPNEKARLLAAARALADATTKMVNAAKDAARNPEDPGAQARMRAAAEALQNAARSALGSDDRNKAFKKLIIAAKAHAAATTQLISASKACSPSNRNQASQMQLINASKGAADNCGQLVTAVRSLSEKPDDSSAQLKLVTASKGALIPGQTLIASSKSASPTIGDLSAQGQLLNFSKAAAESLKKLKEAVESAEAVSGGLELDSAIENIQAMQRDLAEAKKKAQVKQLKPDPDQTAEGCQVEVSTTSKTIGSSMAQLISAATQGNESYTGVAARDTAAALGVLGHAVKGVAATSSDRDLQDHALDQANEVLEKSEKLVTTAKACLGEPQNPQNQQKLAQVASEVNKAMAGLVDSLPGQRDVNKALAHMKKELQRMEQPVKPEPGETFKSAQNRLATAAASVNVASNNLVTAARGTPQELKNSAENLDQNFSNLIDAAQALASQTNDEALKADILSFVNDVHQSMTRLLQASKAFNADPNGPNLKNLLTLAAKGVADSLQKLMSVCTTAGPGLKECGEAQQSLGTAGQKLDAVNDPDAENNDTYFESLKKVLDNQQNLLTSCSSIPGAARSSDSQEIGNQAKLMADAVNNITDANLRSAYLIGVSDDSSVPAVPGLVDQQKFAQAALEIHEACEKLQDPNNKQQQVLAAASIIAKNTASLCNACKAASSKTTNPVAKNQFVASAKTVASTTANLVTNIKALATNPSDENRAKCNEASKPLLDAVDNLKIFASSPEFAATRAYISPVAQQKQQPLIKANKELIENSKKLVESAKGICGNPSDDAQIQLFNAQQKALTDSVKALANALKNGAPGQQECDEAINKVTSAIAELDGASVKATVGSLEPVQGPDHQGFKDALLNNARAVNSSSEIVCEAAQGSPESLGQSVTGLLNNFTPLVAAAIGAASKTNDSKLQADILEKSKNLGESLVELLYASKQAGGNPESTNVDKVADSRQKVADTVQDLMSTLEGASSENSAMNEVINDMENAISDLQGNVVPEDGNYQVYANDVIQAAKELADTMGEVIAKAKTPEELGGLSKQIGGKYKKLVKSARGAAATASDEEVKQGVLDSVRALGGAGVRLIDSMKQAAGNPNDPTNRQKVVAGTKEVSQGVARVVGAIKEGSKGLQICLDSIDAISETISDLETALVFATAGQLDPLDKSDNFNNYKEGILLCTKDLTADVKSLVQGATTTQDNLGNAASQSVVTLEKLRDQIKSAAAAVTSADRKGQEQLLTVCKVVAEHLQNHIRATMDAFGKGPNEMNALRESAKTMVTSISELLRAVKTVGDDATRSIRALGDSILGIDQAIEVLDSTEPAQGTALPEDVVQNAKSVAVSASSLVNASNSSNQDDVINAAGEARKCVEALLRAGKAVTTNAPADKKAEMHKVAKDSANATKELLEAVKILQEKNNPTNKAEVQKAAKSVAERINGVVQTAGGMIPTGYVDPNDPNVIAERELLAAANAIEAAARKLAALQPPERPREANEDLPFEEQILEAAKAIASATAALVRSATSAQREIVSKKGVGKKEEQKYFSDGTWSDGLVSAAKSVAMNTGQLCEAANDAVQGKADREKVIAAARGVSASTVQLLTSATVSTEQNSDSQNRLKAAGKTVTRATNQLVEAAEKSLAFEDTEKITADIMKSGVGAKKMEMEAQAEILRIEMDLRRAREKLGVLRKNKYQGE